MQKTKAEKETTLSNSPLTKGVDPTQSETACPPQAGRVVTQLLKDADAHADCKAELIFYDSHGNPSVTYKMTGGMVRRWVERG
jgi:hypothetical protein